MATTTTIESNQMELPSPLPEMPLLPITSEATVAACRDLKVSDHDIFVCSYPKSGTTWTQNLVCRLLAAHVGMSLPEDWHLSHSAPFYEVDQYWDHSQNKNGGLSERKPAQTPICSSSSSNGETTTTTTTTTYRVFNTHLRPHQLPPNAKCVYVVRDGLDVLASFYYHLANMALSDGGYDKSPQEFCKEFLDGTILYGKWQDHLEAWLGSSQQRANSQNVLVLHYDNMKEDLPREATKIARFLGVADDNLQSVVNTAVSKCTFTAMKEDRWRYTPRSVSWKTDETTGKPYDNFVRSGRIGDGKTFWKTYASQHVATEWQTVLKTTKSRWEKAQVANEITVKYLDSGDDAGAS